MTSQQRPQWIIPHTPEHFLSVLYKEEAQNIEVLLKSRLEPSTVYDILSCEDISPSELARDIRAFRVWGQAVPKYFKHLQDFWEQEGRQLEWHVLRGWEGGSEGPRESEEVGDAINPSHYKAESPKFTGNVEVADVIEMFGHQHNWYRATALAYLFRAGRKSGQPTAQDLRKAIWFIERELATLEPGVTRY